MNIHAVHKNLTRERAYQAARREVVLFYSTRPMEKGSYLTERAFAGEYFIPPEKAHDLYDLIQQSTSPEDIVNGLGLERMTLDAAYRLADTWAGEAQREREEERESKGRLSEWEHEKEAILQERQRHRYQPEIIFDHNGVGKANPYYRPSVPSYYRLNDSCRGPPKKK